MNLFRFVPIIVRWAPIVYSAVITIEEIVGPGIDGKEKKKVALAWLSEMADRFDLPWGDSAISVLSDLIDTTVGILHLTGQFSRTDEVGEDDLSVAVADAQEGLPYVNANLSKAADNDPLLAEFMRNNLAD